MSVEELKRTVDQATPDERLFLRAYLKLKARENDPEIAKKLADAHRRIEAGHYATLDDLLAMDEQLIREGK